MKTRQSDSSIPTTTKERPILFSTEMVRAILRGRKTQTRRIVKPQPPGEVQRITHATHPWFPNHLEGWYAENPSQYNGHDRQFDFIHGQHEVGMRLWVREAFAIRKLQAGLWVEYRDGHNARLPETVAEAAAKLATIDTFRPSIFMPRWASRITLEITDVRCERLQDISHEDAIAEGVAGLEAPLRDDRLTVPQHVFAHLWDAINGNKASWDSNPWVWVISFRRIAP